MRSENNRSDCFLQIASYILPRRAPGVRGWAAWRYLLFVAALWTLCGARIAGVARAESISPVDACFVVPAGESQGVRLEAMTVDIVLSDGEDDEFDSAWSQTDVWLKLSNPATETVTLPITLLSVSEGVGEQLIPIQALLDGRPLDLPATMEISGTQSSGVPVQIAGGGQATIRLNCTNELALDGIARTFTFPLAALAQWSGTPESLRVTLDHVSSLAPDRLLEVQPGPQTSGVLPVEWQWAETRVGEDVRLRLLDLEWWTGYSAARESAGFIDAAASDHLRLAAYLEQLNSFYNGVGSPLRRSEIIAEYHAALGVAQTAAERAAAHMALIELYLDRSAESSAPASDLQAALLELRAARQVDPSGVDLDSLEAEIMARLQSEARLAGEGEVASRYAEETLRGASDVSDDPPARLSQALAAVEGGDFDLARSLLIGAFGAGIDVLPEAPAPVVASVHVTVRMLPTRRDSYLALQGPGASMIEDEIVSAIAGSPGITLERTVEGLRLSVPYSARREVLAAMSALAARIPDRPELALLRASLSPSTLDFSLHQGVLRPASTYVELVDLGPALTEWSGLAYLLESAPGSAPPTFALGEDAAGVLRRVQRALWRREAAAWRALAQASAAEYEIAPWGEEAGELTRRVAAGEARLLVVRDERLATERFPVLALLGAPLLVLLACLVSSSIRPRVARAS